MVSIIPIKKTGNDCAPANWFSGYFFHVHKAFLNNVSKKALG
jgi:hypothetical protein